jgi:hypothetical protein
MLLTSVSVEQSFPALKRVGAYLYSTRLRRGSLPLMSNDKKTLLGLRNILNFCDVKTNIFTEKKSSRGTEVQDLIKKRRFKLLLTIFLVYISFTSFINFLLKFSYFSCTIYIYIELLTYS